MISKAKTVDAFLAKLPEDERHVFAILRQMVKEECPAVEESMTYGMPTYMLNGQQLLAFNRQKNYLCLYANPEAVALHREGLKHLDCGKSCVRFKKPSDLPLDVAHDIVCDAVRLAKA